MKPETIKYVNNFTRRLETVIPVQAKLPAVTQAKRLEAAFRELFQKFKQIPEIGKFEPVKVSIEEPVANSTIKKAAIVVEPLADKNDFRTRVLTFIAESPRNSETVYEISPASGNKFSIDSTLRNPKTRTLFKEFIKSAQEVLG